MDPLDHVQYQNYSCIQIVHTWSALHIGRISNLLGPITKRKSPKDGNLVKSAVFSPSSKQLLSAPIMRNLVITLLRVPAIVNTFLKATYQMEREPPTEASRLSGHPEFAFFLESGAHAVLDLAPPSSKSLPHYPSNTPSQSIKGLFHQKSIDSNKDEPPFAAKLKYEVPQFPPASKISSEDYFSRISQETSSVLANKWLKNISKTKAIVAFDIAYERVTHKQRARLISEAFLHILNPAPAKPNILTSWIHIFAHASGKELRESNFLGVTSLLDGLDSIIIHPQVHDDIRIFAQQLATFMKIRIQRQFPTSADFRAQASLHKEAPRTASPPAVHESKSYIPVYSLGFYARKDPALKGTSTPSTKNAQRRQSEKILKVATKIMECLRSGRLLSAYPILAAIAKYYALRKHKENISQSLPKLLLDYELQLKELLKISAIQLRSHWKNIAKADSDQNQYPESQ